MHIPHQQLDPATLRAVIEEFVTRDGTDDTPVEGRIHAVFKQLEEGHVELHYDEASRSCNVVTSAAAQRLQTSDDCGADSSAR